MRIRALKILPIFVLLTILLFHFINNSIWLKTDASLVRIGYDSPWHLLEAIKFKISSAAIAKPDSALFERIKQILFLFKSWDTESRRWPPLIYFVSSTMGLNDFYYYNVRLYVNFFFYAILIIAVYFLGKKSFNKRIGLMAAFLISFYPVIYALSRQFESDFAVASLVAICACLFLYSENFSNRFYSFLFGLAAGCATLIKLQVIIFLLPFFAYALVKIAKRKTSSKKIKSFINFILIILLSGFICSLWWKDKLQITFLIAYKHAFFIYPFFKGQAPFTLTAGRIPIFSLKNFIFYPLHIAGYVSLPFFALLVIALIFFVFSKNKHKPFFLSCLLFPLLLHTFLSTKSPRYILPILPFFALISAWYIDNIKPKIFKRVVLSACITYALIFYFLTSWSNAKFYHVFVKSKNLTSSLQYTFPDPAIYLKKKHPLLISSSLGEKLKNTKSLKITYSRYAPHIALFLYTHLRDYILVGKIKLERNDSADLYDRGYRTVLEWQYR